MQKAVCYPVSLCRGAPLFDSLPVAKITQYPLEPRDYKPFAQCALCVAEGMLYLRMWAFEVSPRPTSALSCVCYPYTDAPERALQVTFTHGDGDIVAVDAVLLDNGEPVPETAGSLSAAVQVHPHNGEDLQGVYWGRTAAFPVATLEELGGRMAWKDGTVFPGNFYKQSSAPGASHWGSWSPNATPKQPLVRKSMGQFTATAE